MSVDLEDIKRRLVVGHKRGGRCVYDEVAKSELVELCLQPGVSVSRLARECSINANQVSRWLRERGSRKRAAIAHVAPTTMPFLAVPVLPSSTARAVAEVNDTGELSLQARLPNGVTVELRGVGLGQIGEVIQALGRLACSVSTPI
jgi:transposase